MEDESTQATRAAHDRVVAGMCHRLNSQLAAASGYLFLLRRRERLGEFDEPLQGQMDEIARSIHLLRSLCVDDESRPTPVSLGQVVETASEIMEHHPHGPVRFSTDASSDEAILRVDWARALRTFLTVGAWIGRELDDAVEVSVHYDGSGPNGVLRLVPVGDLPAPERTVQVPDVPEGWGLNARQAGERVAEIEIPG